MIYYFQMFNLVYLSFLYKVLRDLQETLEIEIYSQSKNELKLENLEEKGKRYIYLWALYEAGLDKENLKIGRMRQGIFLGI